MIRQLLVLALAGLALASQAKVSSDLSSVLATKGSANIVVKFQSPAPIVDSVKNQRFANRAAKTTFLHAQLDALRVSSQANAISLLANIPHKSSWATNSIFIQGASAELVSSLSKLSEVVEIREQAVAQIVSPIVSGNTILAEWNIDKIGAEAAWALPGGNNGQGTVVGVLDTGVRGTHESYRNNKRNSSSWRDPFDSTELPEDGNGHGSHVTGTILGSGGIGVAPGAQWIACKGCDFFCPEYALVECGEFMACPTQPDGSNPDCSLAAHVVSNSWGGGTPGYFDDILNLWEIAEIIAVFANGNPGSACGGVLYPGDDEKVIGVGSTMNTDGMSGFSGRGPTSDGRIKPEISAPGSDIRSAWATSDTAYNTISGTSMATPHISGVIALLLSSNPSLTQDEIITLLGDHAERNVPEESTCGGSGTWPNNHYGFGRVNATASLRAAIRNETLSLY